MNLAPFDPIFAILAIPASAAVLLAILPGYVATSRLNMLASFLSFLSACAFFFTPRQQSQFFLIDDVNIVFVTLTTFVAFSTSAVHTLIAPSK